MADSKVSELTSATSAGGSDVLYLVQSNTSKKITVANLFNDISNPTLTGNVKVGGTPQTLSSPGVVSLTTPITHLSVDAVGGTLNIPQGADGQVKVLTLTASSGGVYSVNTSNIAGNTNIVFDTVGDTVILVYTNNKWFPLTSTSALDLSSVSANIIPSADSVYDLGSNVNQWRSLYVSNNTIFIGGTPVTVDNGELVIGSGEASANLATVAYVDGAVANAGGGGGLTSADLTTANVSEVTNLYFTNARALAALTTSDAITIESTTDNILITANADVSIEALDDLRLTGNDVVALRNRSTSAPINIITDYDETQYTWEFGADGGLIAPGDITLSGDISGTDSGSTLNLLARPGSNTFIQLNNGVDSSIRTQANLEIRTNGLDPLTWVFDTNGLLTTPSDVNIEGGLTLSQTAITGNRDFGVLNINSAPNPNAYVQLNETGDSFFGAESNVVIYSAGDSYQWTFATDGNLTLPGNLLFSGCVISSINPVSISSLSTLQIVPDNSLFDTDQYLIVDPTEPSHIHIRAGGTIDNSVADLYLGGENSYFRVRAGENPDVEISANTNTWFFYNDGELLAPGIINAPSLGISGKAKFNKVTESYSGIVNPTGAATFDCSSTHIFNVTSINANFTANFTNLDLDNSEATSLTLVLNQGASAYIANVVQIGGVTQNVRWQANAEPTGNVNAVDIQSFSILNVGGNYTVLGQLSTFG